MHYKEDIPKEELNVLPLRAFEGEILVIDTLEASDNAAEYLKRQEVLGFDTETKPCFVKGVRNKTALLQLSTPEKAFLIRCCKIGLPEKIAAVLADKNIKKAGVAIHDDVKGLQNWRKFTPDGFVELSSLAGNFGIKVSGLKKLCGIVLGFRISKAMQLSNWEEETLKRRQQIYAATDAWAGLKIYQKLTEEN